MTEQQQPEPEQQPEAKHLVVILTDGTVAKWPAATTGFRWDHDGDLWLTSTTLAGNPTGDVIAAFARGQWAAAYDDRHLAS